MVEDSELTVKTSLDINEIMSILPHRYPFLLIDRVAELIAGEKVIAIKNVTMNEYFFTGHFPQSPVMPGVLIIEAMAQAGAIAVLSLEEYKGRIAYLGAVDNAKFRAKVIPGHSLRLEVEMVKLKKNAGIGKGTAYIVEDGKDIKAAEAELTFIIG